jgi:hypothetical protein
MKGYNCDNCECHLDDSDFVSHLSLSYICHTCGFTYRHGASPAQEQVDKFNEEQEEDDSYGYAEQKNFD